MSMFYAQAFSEKMHEFTHGDNSLISIESLVNSLTLPCGYGSGLAHEIAPALCPPKSQAAQPASTWAVGASTTQGELDFHDGPAASSPLGIWCVRGPSWQRSERWVWGNNQVPSQSCCREVRSSVIGTDILREERWEQGWKVWLLEKNNYLSIGRKR